MLLYAKKWLFFKDLYFVKFCDEINFANFRKSPRKHQQGGILQYSYSDEKFIQNLEEKNCIKKIWCFKILMPCFLGGGGGDENRSLSMVFCDEIKPPQTVTFLWNIKIDFSFLGTFQLFHFISFQHFLE
jgi:hypothetical protein